MLPVSLYRDEDASEREKKKPRQEEPIDLQIKERTKRSLSIRKRESKKRQNLKQNLWQKFILTIGKS